jgi:hypothetical protein
MSTDIFRNACSPCTGQDDCENLSVYRSQYHNQRGRDDGDSDAALVGAKCPPHRPHRLSNNRHGCEHQAVQQFGGPNVFQMIEPIRKADQQKRRRQRESEPRCNGARDAATKTSDCDVHLGASGPGRN